MAEELENQEVEMNIPPISDLRRLKTALKKKGKKKDSNN